MTIENWDKFVQQLKLVFKKYFDWDENEFQSSEPYDGDKAISIGGIYEIELIDDKLHVYGVTHTPATYHEPEDCDVVEIGVFQTELEAINHICTIQLEQEIYNLLYEYD